MRSRLKLAYEVAQEYARNNIGYIFLFAGAFALGFGTNVLNVAQERKIAHDNLIGIEHRMSQECDSRFASYAEVSQQRMAERDSLLNDQIDRLSEQAVQLQNQSTLIGIVAGRQVEFTERNQKALAALQKTVTQTKAAAAKASETASEARAAAEMAAKEEDRKERQQINQAVRGKTR